MIRLTVAFSLLLAQDNSSLPAGPGKELVLKKCATGCHGVEVATNATMDKAGWQGIVDQMVASGAKVKKAEIPAIVDYLAKNFGYPGAINPNKATAEEIESGLRLTTKEAEAIIRYRKQHGDFKDWHDLLKVDGVDSKKVIAAKDRITL